MTMIVGTGVSAVRSIRVSDNPVRPAIDVDARKALQVRWRYQADRLERAIMAENTVLQDQIMNVLLAIEHEAMANGVLDDLDTGDVDPASGRTITVPVMTAKAAVGHHAEVRGRISHLNYLVWIPKSQQRGDGSELSDRFTVVQQPVTKPGKVKVNIMALGVKANTAAGVPTSFPEQHEVPVSKVGKTAGQPLSAAPGLAVSKAEQLKAMKKAQTATPEGQAKAKAAKASGGPVTPKKPKVITKCLDGCGQDCGGRFAIGHDAKLKSLLSKIERGEIDPSQVPDIARPFVKFGKPVKVATEDGKGHTMTYPIVMAPVRFPGRDDIEYVQDLGEAFGHK